MPATHFWNPVLRSFCAGGTLRNTTAESLIEEELLDRQRSHTSSRLVMKHPLAPMYDSEDCPDCGANSNQHCKPACPSVL